MAARNAKSSISTVLRKNIRDCKQSIPIPKTRVYVVVNFLSQVIFIFLLFLGMVIYANEVETKEK